MPKGPPMAPINMFASYNVKIKVEHANFDI